MITSTNAPTKLLSAYLKAEYPDLNDECIKKSETDGAVILSSPVIDSLLLSAYVGASGKTASQIDAYFESEKIRNTIEAIKKETQGTNKDAFCNVVPPKGKEFIYFGVAIYLNSELANSENNVFKKYSQKVNSVFDASVESLDFTKKTETVNKVNGFVKEKTRGHIESILNNDDITRDTFMVLVSAIYFKTPWLYSFENKATKTDSFRSIRTVEGKQTPQEVKVEFMNLSKKIYENDRQIHYRHDEESGISTFELPYEENGLSMVFFYPKNATHFLNFTQRTLFKSPGTLNDLLNKARKPQEQYMVQYEISVPKFRVASKKATDLKQTMKLLGINKMFEDDADFSGISEDKRLKVTKFVTKAMIQVDEQGTLASATSAMQIVNRCMPMRPPTTFVKVDTPFIYQIRYSKLQTKKNSNDDADGAKELILFQGQVINPASSQKEFDNQIDWSMDQSIIMDTKKTQ